MFRSLLSLAVLLCFGIAAVYADQPANPVKPTSDKPVVAEKKPAAPKAAVKKTQAPKAAVKETQTPKAAVKKTQAPKAAVKKTQTPKAAVKKTQTPKAAVKKAAAPKAVVKKPAAQPNSLEAANLAVKQSQAKLAAAKAVVAKLNREVSQAKNKVSQARKDLQLAKRTANEVQTRLKRQGQEKAARQGVTVKTKPDQKTSKRVSDLEQEVRTLKKKLESALSKGTPRAPAPVKPNKAK